ncbi:MAG: dienelactone hydrolase family protein [Phycisphaerae bacterium]
MKPLPYTHGETALEGYLTYDDAHKAKRPGVLVVHEWWGLNDFARREAEQLARLGYVALAIDMYGKGVTTSDPTEAGKLSGQFRGDPQLVRGRAAAGLNALIETGLVDAARVGAMGFCFGGMVVQQMAYGGLELKGVASFHGSLVPLPEADAPKVKAAVLILHGAADTLIPDEAIRAWQDAMRKTTIDWQFVSLGGAKHSFTNPASTSLGMQGVGYDERADRRAREMMRAFFAEVLGRGE